MNDRKIYWIVGTLFGVLLVVMLATWHYNRSSAEARQKAQALVAATQAAGLRVPADPERVARVLGTDGGMVCDIAGNKLQNGYLKTRLGVGGEFYYRPVTIDRRVLEGVNLIVRIYCPDKLGAVQRFENGLKYGNVVRG